MASKDDTKPRKIIDVAEPGKTAPPATARPIIVSNRPMLKQDPMMVSPDGMDRPKDGPTEPIVSRVGKPIAVMIDQAKKEQSTVEPEPASKPSAPVVPKPELAPDITPPTPVSPAESTAPASPKADISAAPVPAKDDVALQTGADAPKDSMPPAPTPQEPATPKPQDVVPSAEPSTPEPDTADTEVPETTEAAAPTADEQFAPNKLTEEEQRKAAEEQAAKDAEQEKIIASKKYYLPIKATENRRGVRRGLMVLVLVVLLAVVWLDLVLDAGILHVPALHAVTHFFQAG